MVRGLSGPTEGPTFCLNVPFAIEARKICVDTTSFMPSGSDIIELSGCNDRQIPTINPTIGGAEIIIKVAPSYPVITTGISAGVTAAAQPPLPKIGHLQKPRQICVGVIQFAEIRSLGARMARQAGFFDVEERLASLSAKGDSLEKLGRLSTLKLFVRIWNAPCRVGIAPRAAVRHSIMC
jgi:hypothetical protein